MSQPSQFGMQSTGPADGVSVAARVNGSLNGLLSSNSGPTEPGYKVRGTLWEDTTTGTLKKWNGTAWEVIYTKAQADALYGMHLIQAQTFSAASAINFTTGITSDYRAILFIGTDLVFSANANLLMNVSFNGGASYLTGTTGQYIQSHWTGVDASFITENVSNVSGAYAVSNANTNSNPTFEMSILGHSDVKTRHSFHCESITGLTGSTALFVRNGNGQIITITPAAINAVRFLTSAGTVSGKIAAIGIK